MKSTTLIGLVTITITAIAVPGAAQNQRITAKYNAPLKAEPKPESRILATVPSGSMLILDHCDAYQWCHVFFNNRSGWMAEANLNLPALQTGATIRENAALRKGPGIHTKLLGMLYQGTRVNVTTCQTGYCHVSQGAQQGWVARHLINMGGSGGAGPRPPQPPTPIEGSELKMFTERNCRGNTYSTLVSVPNVNYPARSVGVYGGNGNTSRDAWQICVGTNYSGVCTSTTNGCSNLDELSGRALRSVRRFSETNGSTAPGICTREYVPVCGWRSGRQNKTFGNACEARTAGWTVQYQGVCR